MLFAAVDTGWKHIPAERVVDAGLGVINKHSGVGAPKACLAFEEKREVLPVGLRLDFQEPCQALLVEQAWLESVGRGQAANRFPGSAWRTPEFEHRPSRGFLSSLAHVRSR